MVRVFTYFRYSFVVLSYPFPISLPCHVDCTYACTMQRGFPKGLRSLTLFDNTTSMQVVYDIHVLCLEIASKEISISSCYLSHMYMCMSGISLLIKIMSSLHTAGTDRGWSGSQRMGEGCIPCDWWKGWWQ